MANERIVVGIDAGTTKVTTLIAEIGRNHSVHVIGFGVAPCKGLKRGVVVDMDATVEAIDASVEKAERVSGYKIDSAFIGIAGGHITSLTNSGVISITRSDRTITEEDVGRAIDAARVINLTNNREIIHTIPRHFTIDGQEGVRNPIGMLGYRVDVEAHIVTGAVTSIQNLIKCFELSDIDVDQVVLQPLAAAEAVVSDEEKNMGVALVDIGGDITEIVLFSEGSICHTAVINVGGNHITNDISVRLRAPHAEADELKISHSHAVSHDIAPTEMIDVATFGRGNVRSVPRIQICEVAEARLQELFLLVAEEIQSAGYDGLLPAGIVIIGGTAQLSGIEELGSEVTGLSVRRGTPRGVHGLVDALSDPAYATAVGLAMWGARHGEGTLSTWPAARGADRTYSDGHHVGGRFLGWLRAILP